MKSTAIRKAAAEREKLDRYYTPDDVAMRCARTLVDRVRMYPVVLEPSVGGGAFARAVHALMDATVHGVDIDPDASGLDDCDVRRVGRFEDVLCEPDVFDLVIGNPPYVASLAHVQRALTLAPVVGMLLPLAFLATAERLAFWQATPARHGCLIHVLTRRPSFTGDGRSAATDYGWFVWSQGWRGVHVTWDW